MNDTERLDALINFGLTLTVEDVRVNGQWQRKHICFYGEKAAVGASIREVIDAAVLDIKTQGQRVQ